jgi:preprotein translocase subunit SecE
MNGDDMDFRDKFEKIKEYFREVYLEAKRVTWPSKKDAMKGTYIVLITVVIAAIFLGIVDVGLAKIIQALLRG